MEELIILMQPLMSRVLGLTVPSFFGGSPMEDLAFLLPDQGYLHRSGVNMASVGMPDWRSLYFSAIPLWPLPHGPNAGKKPRLAEKDRTRTL